MDLVDEIILLQLENAGGRIAAPQLPFAEVVVAGAAIMDLALRYRIDADLDRFFVADETPLGDPILDDALDQLSRAGSDFSAKTALDCTAHHAKSYMRTALQRLVAKQILDEQDGRYLPRSATTTDAELRNNKAQLREVLLTDGEIPDPGDVMLLCLVEAAGILGLILTPQEIQQTRDRVDRLSRLDLIGHAVTWAVGDMRFVIQHAVPGSR